MWSAICESTDHEAQPQGSPTRASRGGVEVPSAPRFREIHLGRRTYMSRLSAVAERTERTRVMTNPHTAATAAIGRATLKVKVMSGRLWLMAPAMRRTKQRNATEVKKEMTPVTRPIAVLRKRVRIKPVAAAPAALS